LEWDDVLSSLLDMVRKVEDKEARAALLVGLISRLPERKRGKVIKEARAAAWGIKDTELRAMTLTALIPHLPESERRPVVDEALVTARRVEENEYQRKIAEARSSLGIKMEYGGYTRAEALMKLAPYVTDTEREAVLAEALDAVQDIAWVPKRNDVFFELARHLPDSLLQKALVTAQAMEDKREQTARLMALAPHLSEPQRGQILNDLWRIAKAIEDCERKAALLFLLAPYLSDKEQNNVWSEAITAARAIGDKESRTLALSRLVPYLPKSLLREALAAARAIDDDTSVRATIFTAMLPYLSGAERDTAVQEAMSAVEAMDAMHWVFRVKILPALTPHLSDRLLQKVLDIVWAMDEGTIQVEALLAIAPHLSGSLAEETWEAAQAIEDWEWRDEVLASLLPCLPEPLLVQRLEEISLVWSGNSLDKLGQLASSFSESALAEVLTIAQKKGVGVQARAFDALAPYLKDHLLQEALAEILTLLRDERVDVQVEVLGVLAPHLKGSLLEEALKIAWQIKIEHTFSMPNPILKYPPLQESPEIPREIGVVHMSSDPMQEKSRGSVSSYSRVKAFAVFLPYLRSEEEREVVLNEALEAARQSPMYDRKYGIWRAELLAMLVPYFPKPKQQTVLAEALEAMPVIKTSSDRLAVLLPLVPFLTDDMDREAVLLEALSEARKCWTRTGLPTTLPPPFNHAPKKFGYKWVLVELAPHLPKELVGEALDIAQQIGDKQVQAETQAVLLARLKGFPDADTDVDEPAIVLEIEDEWERLCEALEAIKAKVFEDLCSRQDLLSGLATLVPVVHELGHEEAMVEIFHAIKDIERWWP
jgi:hypothetical protein